VRPEFSRGELYDSLAGRTALDMIETQDIAPLNRTMRARSAHSRWAPISGRRLVWLSDINPRLDLIETDDRRWAKAGGERLVRSALLAVVAQGRGVSVGTKMLHLKRPRLFPVLDLLVSEMIGARISPDGPAAFRADQAVQLVLHLRGEGRKNLDALRAIQTRMVEKGIERSLVRILDAILWLSHPGAAIGSTPNAFQCRLA
jgi:Family of unknown function (DUF6308)